VPEEGVEHRAGDDIDEHPQASEDLGDDEASESSRYPVDANAIGPTIGPIDAPSMTAAAVAEDVETALARAVDRASAAGRWDVVAQLAEELRARRLAAAGNVVEMPRPGAQRPRQ
jgi:hypothetical protein